MKYRLRARGSKAQAQRYGAYLDHLSKTGPLNPRGIVDAARPKHSPIHDWFEWDDGAAAEKYREQQAGDLLRFVVCIDDKTKAERRAFLNVVVNKESVYLPALTVMSNRDLAQQVLDEALREAQCFREKYRNLSKLALLHSAIDRVVKKFAKERN